MNDDSHLQFVASEVGAITDYGVLSCGASGSGHYINVQANLEEPDEWGVYFEVDDQINGGYRKIQRVQLAGSTLDISIIGATNWYPNLDHISVDLSSIDSADIDTLRDALNACLSQCGLKVE